MARNIAVDHQRPVAVFSLEMSSVQLVQRLISSETEISSEKLRKGDLRPDEFQLIHSRIGKLSKAPLFIDDTPALSVFELRAKCRRLKQQHNIELVVIDYLQLMTAGGDKGNREQEISTISRSIKSIAKELNIPVIALSQLNRSVETRGGDKKPQLSDLRESGAIEQMPTSYPSSIALSTMASKSTRMECPPKGLENSSLPNTGTEHWKA